MDLDDQAVSADGGARQGHRRNEGLMPSAVARVDDDRQVRPGAQHRHRREIERVARRSLEGADAALAQDDVRVAGRENVLGRQAESPRLRRTGRLLWPTALSSTKFAMLRAPTWMMSMCSSNVGTSAGSTISLMTGRPYSSCA